MYTSGFYLLLKRSILWLKYIMKGIGCKIFIVQFAFIVFIYGISHYSLLFVRKMRNIHEFKMNHYHLTPNFTNICLFQKAKFG